jgi:Leucine-rich repeat (LRR) protein
MRVNVGHSKVKSLAPLSGLKDLTTLDISGTSVHDLAPIEKLPALKSLTVDQGQIADDALAKFKAAAPSVRVSAVKPEK